MSADFWGHPETWPNDTPELVFLARAVREVGRTMYSDWSDLAPSIPPEERELVPAIPAPGADEASIMDALRALWNRAREMPTQAPPAVDRRQRWQAQQAFRMLAEAAIHGHLGTVAVSPLTGVPSEIPREFWSVTTQRALLAKCQTGHDPAEWIFVDRLHLARLLHPEAMGMLDDARRAAQEYMAIERDRAEAEAANAALDTGGPNRSGAPGRPSSMHLIEAEFERRISMGLVLPRIGQEAEVLCTWLINTHPNCPRPTAKTIRNNLLPRHRELSSGATK